MFRYILSLFLSAVLLGLTLAGCSSDSGSSDYSDGSSSTTTTESVGLTIVELNSGVYDISFEVAAIVCEDGSRDQQGFLIRNVELIRKGDFISIATGGEIYGRGRIGANGSFRLSGTYNGPAGDINLLLEGWSTDTGLVGNAKLSFPNISGVKCLQATTFTATVQGG